MREQEGENFTVLDENCKIKTFESAEGLLRHFVEFRLGYYQKRKDLLVKKLQNEIDSLRAKIAFLSAIIEKKLIVTNTSKLDIAEKIYQLQILKRSESCDFLLGMPIYALTLEKYQELLKKMEEKVSEVESVISTKPIDMYVADLKELRAKIKKTFS
jgi:DNA topoisomerase-2